MTARIPRRPQSRVEEIRPHQKLIYLRHIMKCSLKPMTATVDLYDLKMIAIRLLLRFKVKILRYNEFY